MHDVWHNPAKRRWLPLIVLPPILLLDGVLAHKAGPVDLVAVLVTYAAVLPLVVLHRLGLWLSLPLVTGGVAALLGTYLPGTTVVLLPAWAVVELAYRSRPRTTAVAAVALVPCAAASIAPFVADAAEFRMIFVPNLAICELALAIGFMLRNGREAVAREKAANQADAERRIGEERLRIAREVHDVVAHSMVAINVQAGVAAHLLDRDTDQAREALLHIRRTSGEALTDLRATLGVLRDPDGPLEVAPGGTLDDLEGVAERLRGAGVEVSVDVDTVGQVPAPVQAAGHRIVQEALTNVLRHAEASAATVVVRADADALTIVVTDDGDGTGGAGGAGAGVRGMRERALALGGTLEAGPVPGGGWRVEALLPLARAEATA